MANKTLGVKDLVTRALEQVISPYSEDVTLEVCRVIQKDGGLNRTYRQLVNELTRDTVHNWIGRYTRDLTLTKSGETVTVNGPLIKSYKKLRS